MSVVCRQVEVSATGWSLVQRSPTDCGTSLCVIEKPSTGGGYSPASGLQNTNPQWILFRTNFNAHFNINMYVTLSSTCFGPWHAHLQEEQRSPLSTGIVCSRLVERGYQMLCLYSCSSWRWACQGLKHVEDNVTYMFILKCALKLVLNNILYYDARSEKHQNNVRSWQLILVIPETNLWSKVMFC